MLRFLSSLFTSAEDRRGEVDEALIEKAIERVVAGTDQRLRAMGQYRKRLHEPVACAVDYVISLVDALPPPTAISPSAFGEDFKLRALFVSTDHLVETLGKFKAVRTYLQGREGAKPETIFALLTMAWEERKVLGMELEGDQVRRDVLQVAVNFFNHRCIGPTDNEADTRRELKIRAFDFLVEKSLERLLEERGKRRELDHQRHLLKQKLDAMRSGNWGLGSMLSEENGDPPDLAALEAEIARIDSEFGLFRSDQLGLEEGLACIVDVFASPADWLAAREISLRLDSRGIKVPEGSEGLAREIVLTELFSGTGERRIALLGSMAPGDIPETPDFWQGAKRYL